MNKYEPRNKRAARIRKGMLANLEINPGQEQGRPVTVSDIASYALQGHPTCGGKGIIRGTRSSVCRCATRRFFRKNTDVIMDSSGAAWWPAKKVEKTDGKSDTGGAGTSEGGAGAVGPRQE